MQWDGVVYRRTRLFLAHCLVGSCVAPWLGVCAEACMRKAPWKYRMKTCTHTNQCFSWRRRRTPSPREGGFDRTTRSSELPQLRRRLPILDPEAEAFPRSLTQPSRAKTGRVEVLRILRGPVEHIGVVWVKIMKKGVIPRSRVPLRIAEGERVR